MRVVAVLLVAFAACSSTAAPPGPTASRPRVEASPAAWPSPTAASGAYAVIVNHFHDGGDGYTVSMVATDGHVAATANARRRSQFVQFSSLSTSLTTLYYLDGDGDVRYLRPDGSSGLATHFDVGLHQVLAFAVSPDDRRIAVSLLDYTRYPVGTRLFVEDLSGHGNHVELFSSISTLEWPAGWHKGRLVMALGINVPPQNAWEGFSYGHGYHIADAGTGNRLLSLCDGGDSYIPESPAGTVCVQYPNASIVSWDGVTRAVPKAGTCAVWGPMSPNGTMASRTTSPPGGGCTAGSSVFLINPAGVVNSASLAPLGSPEGWIDVNHLVLVADLPPFASPDFQPSETIVDVTSGTTAGFTDPGFFGAALPGGL